MTKTSHKKNRPFDFKLIDLVEPHAVLYLRQMPGMSTFEMMKTKNSLWQQIAAEMGFPIQFCLNRWNNLRGQFQKELKHSNELCPKSGLIRGSTWPYLNRMRFLECTVQANKPKKDKTPKRRVKQHLQQQAVYENVCSPDENVCSPDDSESRLSGEYENLFNVDDITHQVNHSSNLMEDMYDDTCSIIEEIAEEVVGTDYVQQTDDIFYPANTNIDNSRRIEVLLTNFEGETLQRIERRLMAFLCKCHLRSLSEQTIDDLFI